MTMKVNFPTLTKMTDATLLNVTDVIRKKIAPDIFWIPA